MQYIQEKDRREKQKAAITGVAACEEEKRDDVQADDKRKVRGPRQKYFRGVRRRQRGDAKGRSKRKHGGKIIYKDGSTVTKSWGVRKQMKGKCTGWSMWIIYE